MGSKRSFGSHVEDFLTSVVIREVLPKDFHVLRPYTNPEVQRIVHNMCKKYYTGVQQRIAVWGINPGRFGAGVTGLSFTDPYAVKHSLGIATTLEGRRELSAEFIQDVIEAYGGPGDFYRSLFLTALCPLGFVKNGVNINFYDDVDLQRRLTPSIFHWIQQQIAFGVRTDNTVVLGTGKLRTFFEKHIRTQCGFQNVAYLEHPRYIMQYRRKERDAFVALYVDTFRSLR